MNLFVVSGLSGSGKSIVLQALEDLGFYCIDNLPAGLLPHFAKELLSMEGEPLRNAAVGIDARNRFFLGSTPASLEALRQLDVRYKIIFLEADEPVLVKRFKETRRKHPLTDRDTPLLEGIRLEKQLLEPLSFHADRRIDTTHTTPHALRQIVRDFAQGAETAGMTLLFESFGFKHGTPLDADYVFDVRCLPNPYWQQELRRFTGLEPPVRAFLERHEQVRVMFERLCTFLTEWLPGFEREQRSYMTIAIGCTGGQHRSVYLADRLAAHFAQIGFKTQIRHRELS
ncbi:MAG: RNase adapter RapZ [Acidiferrobacteraceae bacterium]